MGTNIFDFVTSSGSYYSKRKVIFCGLGCFVLLSLQDYFVSTFTADVFGPYTRSDGSVLSKTVWYSSSLLLLNEIFGFENTHFHNFHGCFHDFHEHPSQVMTRDES